MEPTLQEPTDLVKCLQALEEFRNVFSSIQMTLTQHHAIGAAVDLITQTLIRLDSKANDWAKQYIEQTSELKADLITTAIDNGVEDKTISL